MTRGLGKGRVKVVWEREKEKKEKKIWKRKEKRSDLEKNPIEKQRILKHPQNLTSSTNTVIREFLYRKVMFFD